MITVQHVACPGCHTFRPAVLDATSGLAAVARHGTGRRGGRPYCITPGGRSWLVRLNPNEWKGRAAAWTA